MESKVNFALVGLFVVTLTAALVAGILWIASGGALKKHLDHYLAIEHESVAGLNPNAAVKYNGVDVGKVVGIHLDPADPSLVTLEFAIERGTPIKTDTVAILKSQGLTGIAYVELTGGTAEAPLLRAAPGQRYPVITTKPSLGARLENVLTTALAKLDSTTNSINALLSEENQQSIKTALANLAAVSQTLADRRQSLDQGIAGAARTFDNMAGATADLKPLLERVSRSAEALEKLGNEAAQASKTAGQTVEAVGGDVRRFTSDTLPEVQRLLSEITVLASSLRRLSERIEGSPGGLLVGRRPVPPGPGESEAK